jgi:predicted MFS family arabinose efflux permease
LLALNNTATYAGLACSGVIGGVVMAFADYHFLSLFAVPLLAAALVFAELAHGFSPPQSALANGPRAA